MPSNVTFSPSNFYNFVTTFPNTDDLRTLRQLFKRKDIIIKPAYKGSAIVVMDTLTSTYRNANGNLRTANFINDSPKTRHPQSMTSLQSILHDFTTISFQKTCLQMFTSRRPQTRKILHITKIHKDLQSPLGHPIISAIGHPTEHISEFVSDNLNPLVSTLPFYIKEPPTSSTSSVHSVTSPMTPF